MNVEDEKGKVKVWKRKNYSLLTFSPTRKRIYPFMRPKTIFGFRNFILWPMNKRFSLAQSIRTNILDMAVMKILMSKAWRILGFEWTVNSNFTPSPSKIGSYPLNICYFIHKARDHNYVYVFRQLSFLAKNVHELSWIKSAAQWRRKWKKVSKDFDESSSSSVAKRVMSHSRHL